MPPVHLLFSFFLKRITIATAGISVLLLIKVDSSQM